MIRFIRKVAPVLLGVVFLSVLFLVEQFGERFGEYLSSVARKKSGVYVFVSYIQKRGGDTFVGERISFMPDGFNQFTLSKVRSELKSQHSITNDPDLVVLNLIRLEAK